MSLSNDSTISAMAPPRSAVPDWLRARSRLAVSLVWFLLVVLIGAANGGYFPTSWGWCALAFIWIAGISFIFAERVRLSRLELAFIGALALLTAWTALSIIWSPDPESSVMQVQRAIVYLSAAVAMVLVVRAGAVAHLLAGLLAGVAWLSAQALAGRLFPDTPVGVETLFQDRLTGAISYANALGVVAVMGALIAIAIAVHARRLAARAAAACVLPLLLTTAYFTFSRGAWVALAVGLLAAIAFDGRRLKLVTTGVLVAAPAAVAVWLASQAPALTSSTASLAQIADEGRELAIELLALTIAAGLIALAAGALEPRVRVPTVVRRGYGAALAIVALVLVGGFVMDEGGPGPLVKDDLPGHQPGPATRHPGGGKRPHQRLASIGTSPRVNFWRVAWGQHEEHPWIGSGAGTGQFWDRHRRVTEDATDGHSTKIPHRDGDAIDPRAHELSQQHVQDRTVAQRHQRLG